MKQVGLGALKKMNKEELLANLPLAVEYGVDIIAFVCKPEDVVVIEDLHPRVRRMFKAMEQKVRVGMPPMTKYVKSEVVSEVSSGN